MKYFVISVVILSLVSFVSGTADVWLNQMHVTRGAESSGESYLRGASTSLDLVLIGRRGPLVDSITAEVRLHGKSTTPIPEDGDGSYHTVTLTRVLGTGSWDGYFVGILANTNFNANELGLFANDEKKTNHGGGVEVRVGSSKSTFYCWGAAAIAGETTIGDGGIHKCSKVIPNHVAANNSVNMNGAEVSRLVLESGAKGGGVEVKVGRSSTHYCWGDRGMYPKYGSVGEGSGGEGGRPGASSSDIGGAKDSGALTTRPTIATITMWVMVLTSLIALTT